MAMQLGNSMASAEGGVKRTMAALRDAQDST
jgi:hypothetical protein